eukprot:980739-Prorocentrum_minimum.AAC.1
MLMTFSLQPEADALLLSWRSTDSGGLRISVQALLVLHSCPLTQLQQRIGFGCAHRRLQLANTIPNSCDELRAVRSSTCAK